MHSRKGVTSRALWTVGLLAAVLTAGIVAITQIAGAAPKGNNGTVKIHDGPGEPSPEVKDETHVCTFHVHAFGFDPGQVLTFVVRSWEPTGDGTTVLTGSVQTDANGEGRDPAIGAYSLPNGHYRLEVDTGNGKPTEDKHKMFWVQCEEETTTTTSTTLPKPQETTTTTSTTLPKPQETTTTGPTIHRHESTTTAGGGLLPTTSSSQGRLARTGANFLPMVATGLLLVVVGLGGLLASRRMRAR